MSCGHSESWAEKVDKDYLCPICTFVCRDAVGCECGKLFCEVAAKQWKSCPTCRKETKKTAENFIRKKIANLTLYCPLNCGSIVRLGEKELHINQYCSNRPIPCPNCQITTTFSNLDSHQRDQCSNRITCPDCTTQVSSVHFNQHRESCPARPVVCPICKKEVARASMGEHWESNVGGHLLALYGQHMKLQEKCKSLEYEVEILRSRVYTTGLGGLSYHLSTALAPTTLAPTTLSPIMHSSSSNPIAMANGHGAVASSSAAGISFSRTTKIFVGGLAPETSFEVFQSYFTRFGTVADAVLMTDKETGRPRGFGFVTFEKEESADLVVAQHQHIIADKAVDCKKAVPKDQVLSRTQHVQGDEISNSSHNPLPHSVVLGAVTASSLSTISSSPMQSQSISFSAAVSGTLAPLSMERALSSPPEEQEPGSRDSQSQIDAESDERFLKAVKAGLWKQAEPGYYYYSGPLVAETGHSNFCDRFTKNGGNYCCCRGTHAENYIKTQIMCKHGASCRFGPDSCGFVHLSEDVKAPRENQPKGECKRGYFCSTDCPYVHHPEALKVWKKRGKGGYPRGFRLQACTYGQECKNKTTCTFYHSPKEAFCSNCSRIGHPVAECKAPKKAE